MNKSVFCVAVISLGLGACASSGNVHADKNNVDAVDASKIATVNRWAADHGAKLMWVHYPQKLRDSTPGDTAK